MRRVRRIRMSLKFLAIVLLSVIRQRAFALKPLAGGLAGVIVTPQGAFVPQMAGGDETPEEKAEREEAERKAAEDEAEAAEAEAKRAEEEREKAEAEEGKWEGEVDRKRAERAVENARAAERKAKAEAAAAKAEADELRQAQETEHETAKRQAEERRIENERLQESNCRLKANEAIREAAAEADVPAKKVRRLLKLVDRDSITFDADGEVDQETVANAVVEVLGEFPEFKATPKPANGDPEPPENPGGAPDRKRRPKNIDRAEVERLAKEDPDELNRLIDEGKIPASALG